MATVYDDATWGNIGKDIVPSRFYQAFMIMGRFQEDDESLYYEFNEENKSEISLSPEYENYEANKWGLTRDQEEIEVTITPNATLKSTYPDALVRIDGKEYDLAILDSAVKLVMNKDHRISIVWAPGVVETFRIIKLK